MSKIFSHTRPLFAFGTQKAFSSIISNFECRPTQCLYFNSSINPTIAELGISGIKILSHFAWESLLLNIHQGLFSPRIPANSQINLQSLSSLDLLIARRLFNRHILSIGNHNLFDYLSEVLLSHILLWLKEFRPESVYSPEVPHQYGDFMLVCACRILNIPIYFCRAVGAVSQELFSIHSPFQTHCINLEFKHSSKSLAEIYAIEKIYNNISSQIRPYPVDKQLQQRSSRSKSNKEFLSKLTTESDESVRSIVFLQNKIDMHLYYIKNSSTPDFGAKNLVLYLHYEPEANSVPCGYSYYDQLTFASKLGSFCFEAGVNLYIKEHPDQLTLPIAGYDVNQHFLTSPHLNPRDITFYKLLRNLPSFKGFLHGVSTETLLIQRVPCATLTGSVGLQFSANNIPTIISGPTYYEKLHHVKKIHQIESASSLIRHLESNCTPDQVLSKAQFISCILPIVASTNNL